MIFKHRPKTEWPDISKIKDEMTRQFATDIGKLILDSLRNIYDDLKSLEKPERVTSLPAASISYRGKCFLLENAGAEDTLHICLYNAATETYSWKQVTLT